MQWSKPALSGRRVFLFSIKKYRKRGGNGSEEVELLGVQEMRQGGGRPACAGTWRLPCHTGAQARRCARRRPRRQKLLGPRRDALQRPGPGDVCAEVQELRALRFL